MPLEGCWSAEGLEGAAPGATRKPVRLQYCFSSPARARLTVYDLDGRGAPEDACTSPASVSGSGGETLIAGDPGGAACYRDPDASYYAMSLTCRSRPGGEVGCRIDT
jgi:hypothetical protein